MQNYPINGVRICIDSKSDDITGRVYMALCKDEIPFHGCRELLLKCDAVFEKKGYPQAFQEKRSFLANSRTPKSSQSFSGRPEMEASEDWIFDQSGEYATVDVIVFTRRNTTWQGLVLDDRGEEIGSFEGELELLSLLNRL